MNRSTWVAAAASICLSMVTPAAAVLAAPTPASDLLPPPDAMVIREVQGGGAQLYACRAVGGTFNWTLVGPKAILLNADGSDFGMHSAGPTWTATDGSSIVADGAHPLAKSERLGSVPALLLAVKAASGSGVLTSARFVRRADTQGGLPPDSGCDAAHVDATIARHYSAVYTFYR